MNKSLILKNFNYAIYDVYEQVKNLNVPHYTYWFMFDKNYNIYWVISNYVKGKSLFTISIFKYNQKCYQEFNFNNKIADATCTLKGTNDNPTWFIEEIDILNPYDRRKGLGTRIVNLIQTITYEKNKDTKLAGFMKVFKDGMTIDDLKGFYLCNGFEVDRINKSTNTGVAQKIVSVKENEKLLDNIISATYDNFNFNIIAPKELKLDLQNFINNNLCKEK